MNEADELDAVLGEVAGEHGVAGAAAGLVLGGGTHTATYGVTNAEHPLPVSSATLFQVGSITKTFTSAAVMLLVEEGLLDLDDPVARHLPEVGPATGLDLEAMTVEHLLSHQSGFDGDHLFVDGADDGLEALADARRLFEPGAGFSYNNAGFSIAGAIVEARSRQPFDAFVRDRLLLPLGMTSATFRADDAITHSVAAPHWVHEGQAHVIRGAGWQPGWELEPLDRPAGGLVASVDHLLAWGRFQWSGLAADGTRLLGPKSLERLHRPVVTADLVDEIALDWYVQQSDDTTTIGHGGVTAGYVSDLVVVPEREVVVVGLTNSTSGASVNQAVRRWALERHAGIREQDPAPDPTVGMDAGLIGGRFVHPFAVLTLRPGENPGTVVIESFRRDDVHGWQPPLDPPIESAFCDEHHLVSLDAPGPVRVSRLGFDPDGSVAWIQSGGRRALRID